MAKIRVSYEYTEAEDKSIRLGLFLIATGIVSLFILGFCWLNPALQDLQGKAANCTVVSVQQVGELFECTFTCGADCKGTALYPCLQIYVNNSESDARALLHQDEHELLANPKSSQKRSERSFGKFAPMTFCAGGDAFPHCASSPLYWLGSLLEQCSYIPPCKRENQKNTENVKLWQVYWEDEVGSQPFTCYFNQHLRPDDVLLRRTHDESVLLHCFLWPVVTFLVGVLIVVLTICAKSLAVKAEAIKKRKHS
ncbi:calcium-activated potassium channel subunit beta-4 [Podarcis lilfordi]|uniref:Calcium-activated potassium channel subunit beta-4 n=1 Tax=Podarcis lilfordi TaxID=74358 RepID=A0AA35KY75_9SAUR|nr:calcium-activated potassium channel subunit beta-4 [Podarcis lilfordi]